MSSCSSRCFRIQSTERKGNIALAKRDYARGEVICENVAYCWVVRNHLWGYKCSYCFTSSGSCDHNNASGGDSTGGVKLLRCGKCKLLSYCSAECQKHDWVQHHKLECKHLSDWSQRASGELLDNIILLGRTIRKLKSSTAEISLTADCRHNTSASTPPGKSYPVVQCSSFHVNSLTNGGKFDDTSLMAIEKACKVLGYSVNITVVLEFTTVISLLLFVESFRSDLKWVTISTVLDDLYFENSRHDNTNSPIR
jgi:hypothetical protein